MSANFVPDVLVRHIVRHMPKDVHRSDIYIERMSHRDSIRLSSWTRVEVEDFSTRRKARELIEGETAFAYRHIGAEQVDDVLRHRRVLVLRIGDSRGRLSNDGWG